MDKTPPISDQRRLPDLKNSAGVYENGPGIFIKKFSLISSSITLNQMQTEATVLNSGRVGDDAGAATALALVFREERCNHQSQIGAIRSSRRRCGPGSDYQ